MKCYASTPALAAYGRGRGGYCKKTLCLPLSTGCGVLLGFVLSGVAGAAATTAEFL